MKALSSIMTMCAVLVVLAANAGAAAPPYVNRVWHYPEGQPAYYTIEPQTVSGSWSGTIYVEDTITVAAGTTLSVASGTTVQVADAVGIYVNGTLTATGATFTRSGGNYWRGIYLASTAGASALTSCNISYAGAYQGGAGLGYYNGGYRLASLFVDDSNPTISSCQISNSQTHGIELWSSQAQITSNTFSNMGAVSAGGSGYYPIVFDTLDTYPVMSGNSTGGSGENGIAVPGGTMTTTGRWRAPGTVFPYLMNGSVTLAATKTLTVDPGVTVKAVGSIGLYANGALNALGTSALPITFTSRAASPAAGNWNGIYLSPDAGASALSYVTVNYAGAYNGGAGIGYYHSGYRLAAVFVDSVSPPLTNLSVLNSGTNGLELYSASPAISNATLSNCAYSGLYANSNSRPAITNSAINSNGASGYYAVSLDATSVPNPSGVTFSGNSYQGIQNRGGTLASNATWKKWNATAPHAVTGDVSVAAGVTLTIEPTATVKLWGNTGLYVNGSLSANSTTGRITFTSLADDSIAGDTNGDGSTTVAAAGNWKGIYLSSASGSSVLANCDIRYAGAYVGGAGLGYYNGGYRLASLFVDDSNPLISGCQLSNSQTHGIELWSSEAQITSNSFSNMGSGYYPIVFDTLDTYPVMSGNSTGGSGENGIAVPGGTMTTTGRWRAPGTVFPYLLNGSVTLAVTKTLTVDPGVTVKAVGNIGLYANGALNAVGTSALPITFTSRAASPAAGNWNGIYLSPTAGASALSYVTVNYAGAYNGGAGIGYYHGGYRLAAVFVDSVSPPLTNLSVLNSGANGLELYSASPAISNATLSTCAYSGLYANSNSRPAITNSAINNNGASGYYAVSLDATSVPNPSGVTFSGNSYQGVQNRGGTLASNATWKKWNAAAPYAVTGDVSVAAGVTLTIEPTATVKLWGTGIYVYGSLSANSATGRITFTSLADDSIAGDTNGNGTPVPADLTAGNWKGIYLSPASGSSVLANCDIRYAGAYVGGAGLGYYNGGYRLASLFVDDSNPLISGCQISNSQTHGIELWSSQAQITSNSFSNMGSGYYPIVFDTLDTYPVMSGNSTGGSGENGIAVPGGTMSTTGRWRAPGTVFPYLLNGSVTVAATRTLTVDPGVTVKAVGNIGFYANGALNAVGTSALPITFTSRAASPAAGNWNGIYLSPDAGASVLSYVTVNYAGAYNGGAGIGYIHGGYRLTALYVDAINPPLTNLSVLNSLYNGLELYAASPAIANSRFENCSGTQIAATAGSRPTVISTRFIGTSASWGFTTDTLTPAIIAHNNYWGAASGPYDPSNDAGGWYNPSGGGVRVSDGIDYSSYATSDASVVLTITFAGTGGGTVTSSPGDVTCTSTTAFSRLAGVSYSLLATGDVNSTFGGWSGACSGSGACNVTLNSNTAVTATFSFVKPARIYGATPVYYDTLTVAYGAASEGSLIQLREYLFSEGNVTLGRAINVKVNGGFDKTFASDSGLSQLQNTLTIGRGSLTVENLAIK